VNTEQVLTERIRAARLAADLTQAQLAAMLDVTRSSVANMEAGRQAVTVPHLLILLGAFGSTLIDGLVQEMPPELAHRLILSPAVHAECSCGQPLGYFDTSADAETEAAQHRKTS
jgi:transcriptional regulator with XRE-family HTH domain